MNMSDTQVIEQAEAWLRAGRRVVLGTVVRTWGSAPRPVGALVALRDDGLVAGSVSGGCIEDDLVDRMRRGELATDGPERATHGVSTEQASRAGLPCGGTIELVLEPLGPQSRLAELLERTRDGHPVARTLDLKTGAVTLADAPGAVGLACDDARLTALFGSRLRLLLIGAGQLSRAVAALAPALDYRVTVCDPREEYADGWLLADAELVRTMPDDTVLALRPDAHTAILALTHDPKLDDMALIEALRSPAFYVGAIGSVRNQSMRRERLRQFGLGDEELARLHGPVGLKNGARTPAEIAVAILAHMTAVKYGVRLAAAPVTEQAAPAAPPGA